MKIKIGIAGYGNLGKGVESAIHYSDDMELVAVFTRRNPDDVKTLTGAPVYDLDKISEWKDRIDVVILCGGSANDLPTQTPELAKYFTVIDSFDTHARIPEHFSNVDEVCRENNTLGIISVGWDPGLFSLNRLLGQAILPNGSDYTFWGRGVSQGHSDAVRRVPGVKDARQYTIPVESALAAVREGKNPVLTTREKHIRECFVVAEEGADLQAIEDTIKTMPNYFADYDTIVHFIDQEEFNRDHLGIPHGGVVIRSGKTGMDGDRNHVVEFKITLDSNPEFTASVLVAYARAAFRMRSEGIVGCKTVFDIAPAYLHPSSPEEQRRNLL
ncbi:MAG: diaminopimelate dehydrogenase [Candidatus Methanomethylophilaceae archaeon]|nr:diaminopimelate dehydrogenase [Candidatus Methanomethylophilaceae archaeon]